MTLAVDVVIMLAMTMNFKLSRCLSNSIIAFSCLVQSLKQPKNLYYP